MSMSSARKRTGLRQRQVAEALGVSVGAGAMWDTGVRKPRLALLPQMAALSGCTVDEHVRGGHGENGVWGPLDR